MGFGFGVRDECGGEVGEEISEIWVWVWIVIGAVDNLASIMDLCK